MGGTTAWPSQVVQYGHKLCSKCEWSKPVCEFHKAPNRSSGYSAECKECRRAMPSQSHERRLEASRRYYHRAGKKKIRDKLYGLEPGQYDALLAAQNGVCAICGNSDPCRSLSVDHDHATGEVRGLLCINCNSAIGMLREDPELFSAAVVYLREGGPHGGL